MKLLLKNLRQQEFPIEIESDQKTVKDLKLEIEKVHKFPADTLKLLHSGIVLEDSKTLEEYKIKEGNVIIMMILKSKKPAPQPEPNPNPQENPQPQEQPKAEEKSENKDNKEQFAKQINDLVEMGYERDKAEKAIKAANGSLDAAVEYLNSGNIPEPSQGGANFGNLDQETIEELKKNASIIKCLCVNNPEKLPSIMANIKTRSPELFEIIKQHEEDFKNLLVSPLTQEDINNFQSIQQELRRPQGPQIRLTKEESDAVKRLQDLGNFSQAEAVQAYLACDKNEEMAANFLFEQKMREDEENSRNNNQNQGQGQGQGQG